MAVEVAKLIDYSAGKTGQMLDLVEADEYLTTAVYRSGQKRDVYMITEPWVIQYIKSIKKAYCT